MIIELHSSPNAVIAEINGEGILVSGPGDILGLVMQASEMGASSVALHEANIDPRFFQLRTGVAGEIFQKLVNYRFKLAIIGDISRYTETSESLRALVRECNRGRDVVFVRTLNELLEK